MFLNVDHSEFPVRFDRLDGVIHEIFENGHQLIVFFGHKIIGTLEFQLNMDILIFQNMVSCVFKDL